MTHLPEYSDDLAHCDPCGWPEADTEYVPAVVGPASSDRRINPSGGSWPVFAFLKRTCLRCGFQWAEAQLPPQVPDSPCERCHGSRKDPEGFDTSTGEQINCRWCVH